MVKNQSQNGITGQIVQIKFKKEYGLKQVIDQMADGTLVSPLCHPCVTLASP